MYENTPWRDHVTNPPNCVELHDNKDGTYSLVPAGEVVQQGTPQNEANFNNIEKGISDSHLAAQIIMDYVRRLSWRSAEMLKDGAISTNNIADEAVTTVKLLDGAVTRKKLSGNFMEHSKATPVRTFADLDSIINRENANCYLYHMYIGGLGELYPLLGTGPYIGVVINDSVYLIDPTTKATWSYEARSNNLKRHTVKTQDIEKGAVTTENLANGAVTPEKMTTHDLTVMTFNNQGWTGINSNVNLMNSIFDKYKPDIVGFQEYYTGRSIGGIPTDDYVKGICPDLVIGPPDYGFVCNALISKYELTEPTATSYASQAGNLRYYQKSYIFVNGIKIAVFNTHLETTSNYSYKKAQTLEIVAACAKEDNFILIGDFNTNVKSPEDAAYADFVKPFVDAGFNLANCSEKFGYMNTWTSGTTADHSSWCPSDNIITSSNIRIDRAFVDRAKIEANTGKVIDHLPVVAYLTIHIPKRNPTGDIDSALDSIIAIQNSYITEEVSS